MSSTIIVNRSNITDTTNNSIFKYNFDSPTELTGKEIALVSTSLNYSWRNITEANNTFSYKLVRNGFLDNITIPQTNMGITYNPSHKVVLSLNVDHMKYKVVRGQNTSIDGTIEGDYESWKGIYENEAIIMTNDLLKFEHTDGLNYINLGYSRVLIDKKIFKSIGVTADAGGSAGFMLPKTNSELLGKDRHDDFNLAGCGIGVHSGVLVHIGKPFFFGFNAKGGFINMPNMRTTQNKADSASQHFFFVQGNFIFGFTINTKKIKKPSN